MIQKGTYLTAVDNSGAGLVCCIHLYNGYRRRYASIGDMVLVAVKTMRSTARENIKIKEKDKVKGLIVRTKSFVRYGPFKNLARFTDNGVILLNNQNKFLGTRIFGGIPDTFRKSRYLKISSMASGLVSVSW